MLETKELSELIEDIVWDKDVSHLEAVMIFCETHDIDPEMIADVIRTSQPLMYQIYKDAEDLKLVEKINRLPDDIE